MSNPLISICIPAYKRTSYLSRLLNSIASQTFRNFEVVITDDSDTDEVYNLCVSGDFIFPIVYKKNIAQLGSPANWNEGIQLCTGDWIKIMHDDDWFATNTALANFAFATKENKKLIWCNYTIVNGDTLFECKMDISEAEAVKIILNPFILFKENYIGPPSCIMVHRSLSILYDDRMIWLVDIDYYIQILRKIGEGKHINKNIILFSQNDEQLTNIHFNNKNTVIYESLLLWGKYGNLLISNVLDYDAWWRMIRNLGVSSIEEFKQCAQGLPVPTFIGNIISFQNKIPAKIINNPVFSKSLMLLCYTFKYQKSRS
jgi:glycosyltransferase involved in cell wall biosynthesis